MQGEESSLTIVCGRCHLKMKFKETRKSGWLKEFIYVCPNGHEVGHI